MCGEDGIDVRRWVCTRESQILQWGGLFLLIPDLAPTEFHVFGPLKDTLRGRNFAGEDELNLGVHEGLRLFSRKAYSTCTQNLTRKWKKCFDNAGDFMEKVCVKYVPVMYAGLNMFFFSYGF